MNAPNSYIVLTDPDIPTRAGLHFTDYASIHNCLTANYNHYYVNAAFIWEYTSSFSCDVLRLKNRDSDNCLIPRILPSTDFKYPIATCYTVSLCTR